MMRATSVGSNVLAAHVYCNENAYSRSIINCNMFLQTVGRAHVASVKWPRCISVLYEIALNARGYDNARARQLFETEAIDG